jgi:HAD superfamily hydrolase (TIGR01509 family)
MKGALLLDCDGVIVDSESLNLRAWEDACGAPASGRGALGALTVEACLARLLGERAAALSVAERDALLARKHARYAELAAGGLPLVPGILALIAAARARGWGVAIVSGAQRPRLEVNLRATGVDRLVDLVIGGAKLWADAALRLGAEPARCVALDDGEVGVAAARAQAIGRVVGVATSLPAAALLAAGAHETVARPDEVGLAGEARP